MALTPDSTRALKDAIDAIVTSCGDDPKYKDLIGKLKSVEEDVSGDADGDVGLNTRDTPTDDHSFETAQKRHIERTAAANAASASTGVDGAAGGESK